MVGFRFKTVYSGGFSFNYLCCLPFNLSRIVIATISENHILRVRIDSRSGGEEANLITI